MNVRRVLQCHVGEADSGIRLLPEAYIALCDASQSHLVLNTVSGSQLAMRFNGKVGAAPADFLVNSGAGVNCISTEFARKAGISWDKASDVRVTLPDGMCN